MSQGMHSSFPSTICRLTLLFGVTVSAHAQDTYELRCRGGAKAFVIDQMTANTLSLDFSASVNAAGPEGQGLEPGRCSWIDRAINQAEPKQIRFSVSESDPLVIRQYLNDASNQWTFFVFNTGKGYFEAKSNRPWATNADIIAPGRPIIGADVTTSGGRTTRADVAVRRPGLDPTSSRREPTIDKQIRAEATAIQFFRNVRVEDVTARSFTLSFTTLEPARNQVRVGIWSFYFSLDGKQHWVLDQDVEYDGDGVTVGEPFMNTNHRITFRLRRDMAAGERRRLSINAVTEGGRRFDYEQIFTTP